MFFFLFNGTCRIVHIGVLHIPMVPIKCLQCAYKSCFPSLSHTSYSCEVFLSLFVCPPVPEVGVILKCCSPCNKQCYLWTFLQERLIFIVYRHIITLQNRFVLIGISISFQFGIADDIIFTRIH